jgi:hypothetical protein
MFDFYLCIDSLWSTPFTVGLAVYVKVAYLGPRTLYMRSKVTLIRCGLPMAEEAGSDVLVVMHVRFVSLTLSMG